MGEDYSNARVSDLVGLKELRNVRGLSLDAASSMIGISDKELLRYEENPEEVPVVVALRIANAYRWDYDSISFIKKGNPSIT